MESDQVIVDDAEALFLFGNFRKSLLLCNKLLSNAGCPLPHVSSSRGSPAGISATEQDATEALLSIVIDLNTPLCLSIDASHKERKLSVITSFQKSNGTISDNKDYIGEIVADNESQSEDDKMNSRVTLFDRAAVIALQSWYEIARSIERNQNHKLHPMSDQSTTENKRFSPAKKNSKAAQGNVHLLPFLNAYTTTSSNQGTTAPKTSKPDCNLGIESRRYSGCGRPMPLDLAVVYLRFLRTSVVGHLHEAVELSCEILHRFIGETVSLSSILPSYVRNSCDELFCFVMEETLAFCASQNTVVIILKRFLQSPEEVWLPTSPRLQTNSNDQPNSDAILTILSFLNKLPTNWSQISFPSQKCIHKTRSTLKRYLNLLELQNQKRDVSPYSRRRQLSEDSVLNEGGRCHDFDDAENRNPLSSSEAERASGSRSLLETSFKHKHERRLPDALIHINRITKKLVQRMKDGKATLVFFLVMVLLAWKKRQKAASLSAAALRLFLAPIREVVDAVLKPT